MAKTKKATDQKRRPLVVEATKDETQAQSMARVMVGPGLRHGVVANSFADKMMGKLPGEPRFDDYAREIKAKAEQTAKGDVALASDMLTAQAHSLDAIFTEMARRAALNMGEYVQTAERYMRLALKAQANSRATLEALVRLHQPREQIVKHVHVNEGGQAVVADHFHSGGPENGKSNEQSDATGAAVERPALPSPDPQWNGMPIPSREREAAVQNARRNEPGTA